MGPKIYCATFRCVYCGCNSYRSGPYRRRRVSKNSPETRQSAPTLRHMAHSVHFVFLRSNWESERQQSLHFSSRIKSALSFMFSTRRNGQLLSSIPIRLRPWVEWNRSECVEKSKHGWARAWTGTETAACCASPSRTCRLWYLKTYIFPLRRDTGQCASDVNSKYSEYAMQHNCIRAKWRSSALFSSPILWIAFITIHSAAENVLIRAGLCGCTLSFEYWLSIIIFIAIVPSSDEYMEVGHTFDHRWRASHATQSHVHRSWAFNHQRDGSIRLQLKWIECECVARLILHPLDTESSRWSNFANARTIVTFSVHHDRWETIAFTSCCDFTHFLWNIWIEWIRLDRRWAEKHTTRTYVGTEFLPVIKRSQLSFETIKWNQEF